ncbi:hypothetical protein KVT40_009263 [Elsinoe batatas]|uniref:Uncharacterized protein n=1 Tax=Elsinoe batatas TaxID=2601811 RepID=A0A8K0KS99_9PEZI|nr:hypothetical protein KVT40_009263 [Elsinoe batatas]
MEARLVALTRPLRDRPRLALAASTILGILTWTALNLLYQDEHVVLRSSASLLVFTAGSRAVPAKGLAARQNHLYQREVRHLDLVLRRHNRKPGRGDLYDDDAPHLTRLRPNPGRIIGDLSFSLRRTMGVLGDLEVEKVQVTDLLSGYDRSREVKRTPPDQKRPGLGVARSANTAYSVLFLQDHGAVLER